ncbi:MAG: glycosyltransferase [Alphaproteobacteria bacterium]|nr:glycosyltransferase [Alphaproteobacteria bacterium]
MNSLGKDRLRILYVGPVGGWAAGTYRVRALKDLGHEVRTLNVAPVYGAGGRLARAARLRYAAGSAVAQFNGELVSAAREFRPDLIWLEKAVFAWPQTIAGLRDTGAFVLHQNDDDPFKPAEYMRWRHILASLPLYDLNLVTRRVSLNEYAQKGARDVRLFIPAYDHTVHFPSPDGWQEAGKSIDVSFVGHHMGKRPGFLAELYLRHGIATDIFGTESWNRGWPRAVLPKPARHLYKGGPLSNDAYRQTIWRSRITIGFVNEENREEYAARSFDTTACGGFLLVEDTPGHREHYKDGQEAVFFTSVADCAEKIRRYLPDAEARARIAEAGYRRATSSGYGTDARVAEIIDYIRERYRN